MVMKMDRKADKRDKKIIGMLKHMKQELKYVQVLVKDHAVDGYAEKYKDLVVSIPLLTQDFTKNTWRHFENGIISKTSKMSLLNQSTMRPLETVYSSCLCSFRTMAIGLYLPRNKNCTTG